MNTLEHRASYFEASPHYSATYQTMSRELPHVYSPKEAFFMSHRFGLLSSIDEPMEILDPRHETKMSREERLTLLPTADRRLNDV